jgi:hypothetical protein
LRDDRFSGISPISNAFDSSECVNSLTSFWICALGLDEQAILIHPGLDLMMVATANEDWIGWSKYFKGYVMRAVTGDTLPNTTPIPTEQDMGLLIIGLSVSVVIVALVVLLVGRKIR